MLYKKRKKKGTGENPYVEDEKSTKKKLKGGIDAHKRGCNIFLLNEMEEKVKEKRIQTIYKSFSNFFSPFLEEYDVEVALESGNLEKWGQASSLIDIRRHP